MRDSKLVELIDLHRYEELEDYWFEQMTSGAGSADDFLEAARLLGRKKEKERALMLMGLFAEHLRQTRSWNDRLRILKEIARHTPVDKVLEEMKIQIEETMEQIYVGRPSLPRILRHFHYDDLKTREELIEAVEKIELWLKHDVGQAFYESGRGVGVVKEINLNLGFLRIDFESRKDVSVEPGDTDLVPLPDGHVLRQKVDRLDDLRREAEHSPPDVFGRLLRDMGHPLKVGELKECLEGVVPAQQWSRWWTAARKNPQVVVSGKGAQATYSWTESTTAAEDAVRKSFLDADLSGRIMIARRQASRNPELAVFFSERLLQDIHEFRKNGSVAEVLELLELFSKWPAENPPDPGFQFEDVVMDSDPLSLLDSIENAALKIRVLLVLQNVFPEDWKRLWEEAMLRESNPKVHQFLYESLLEGNSEILEDVISHLQENPIRYPGLFAWICSMGAQDNLATQDLITDCLDGKMLLSALSALDEPEFSSFRNGLKKSLEGGLLINILNREIEKKTAEKALDLLTHCIHLEDYRRDRWMMAIRMRFPELKQQEEWVFSTAESLERKRAEIEHLINVELPKNRKAVGEAAALGDLSENHEYKAARERQDYLINRLQHLQNDLSRVRVIEPGKADCAEVRPGTCITLIQSPERRVSITILGPWEADPKENVYSYQSPIGSRLLGKTAGEVVEWNGSPWTIEKIEPW